MQKIAYLSLGSNIGDRVRHLRSAIERLRTAGEITAVSSLYETEPVEVTQQPWFLNCAVGLTTQMKPGKLLTFILSLEREMGRERLVNKGPRTIDLDILLFGDEVIDTPELTIPHPAMQQRAFVLVPLAEIAPGLEHPLLKKSISELSVAAGRGGPIVQKVVARDWTQESRA